MNETGPSKIKKVGTSPGIFLTLSNLNGGAVATQLSPLGIAQDNMSNFINTATGAYTFAAFSLVPSASAETWQLQFILTRGPGLVSDNMPLMAEMPFVLGELPHEGGLAGLVPRFDGYGGSPTPGSQLRLRRPNGTDDDPSHIVLENSSGRLTFHRGDFYFLPNQPGDTFQLQKIVNLYNVGVTEPIEFEEHPWNPHFLQLKQPPAPEHAGEETAEYVAEPWAPLYQHLVGAQDASDPPTPLPQVPRSREEVEKSASDNLGAALLAGSVALISACGALAFGGRSHKKKKA